MESPLSGSFFQRTVSIFHKFFAETDNIKEFTPKRESASNFVTRVEKDVKDSIEGHSDFHCKNQNCDVDMGVQVCQDIMFTNETINPPSVAISQEHRIEAGNEVSCETSPVTPSLEMSSIVSNTVDSSTESKRFGRRMTRSLKKMDNGFSLVNDISNLDKGTPNDSVNSRNVVVSKLSGRCGEGSSKTTSCSNDRKDMSSERKNKDGDDFIFITRTNMKGCRNKKKRPQKEEDVNFKEAKSKSKMRVKRKLITSPKSAISVKRKLTTSPKSARSTFLMGNKGSEERNESANILSLESFSGKKSRSGRIVLPPLEFWRNQKVVFDEDGKMCGVQEPDKRKLITSTKSAISVKRKLITSPKSARSTFLMGNKGSEEQNESANILSLESFNGKKSRSGRIVLPPLEFWRNQKVVYDEDGQMCGVQDPK